MEENSNIQEEVKTEIKQENNQDDEIEILEVEEVKEKKDFSNVHSLFYNCIRYYNNSSELRCSCSCFQSAKNFEQVFHRSCHECNWSEYQYCEISENRSQTFASWIQLLDRYYLYEFADATRIRSVVKLRIFLIGGSGFRSFYFCILANRSAITIRKHPTNTKHHCIPIFVKNAEADSVRISTRFTPILSTDSVAARWLPHSASSTN